jgi:hypothetical protein
MHDQTMIDLHDLRHGVRAADDALGVRFAQVEQQVRMVRLGGPVELLDREVDRLLKALENLEAKVQHVRNRLTHGTAETDCFRCAIGKVAA